MAAIPILEVGLQLINKLFPDPSAKQAAQLELLKLQQDGALKQLQADVQLTLAAAENVRADSQSESWLASSWRPIVMLTFTALIVARWLGWSVPGISEAEILHLWDIVEFGLGGYVVGRSVEKIAPQVVSAMKGAK
jgi:hypothetical protein